MSTVWTQNMPEQAVLTADRSNLRGRLQGCEWRRKGRRRQSNRAQGGWAGCVYTSLCIRCVTERRNLVLPLIKRWASRWPTSLSEPKTKSALEPWCLTWRKLGASVHYIRLTSACQDCPANKRARSAWSFALSMYRGSTYSLAILKVCEFERFFNNYSRYLPWAARRLICYNTLYRPRRAAFVN